MFQTMYFDQMSKRFEQAKKEAFKEEYKMAEEEIREKYK